jgi:hypothetical protein
MTARTRKAATEPHGAPRRPTQIERASAKSNGGQAAARARALQHTAANFNWDHAIAQLKKMLNRIENEQ